MIGPDEGRRYNAEETALILRRATELKPSVPERIDALSRDGITLDQLTEAATEAGIDAAAVRTAALELETPPALKSSAFFGAPTRLVEERVIDRVVQPEEFEAFVDEVRRAIGIAGVVTVTPRSMSWASLPPGSSAPAGRRLQVTLVARAETTVLRVEEDLTPDTAGLTSIGVVALCAGGFPALVALASVGPVFLVAFPIIPWGIWRGMQAGFRRTFARARREASDLATYLAQRAKTPLR